MLYSTCVVSNDISIAHCDHTDSRTSRGHLHQTGLHPLRSSVISVFFWRTEVTIPHQTYSSTQSSSTNIAARRFSCCTHTVWNSLPSFVSTTDSLTSSRSRLYVHKTSVAGPLSVSLISLPGLLCVTHSVLANLVTVTSNCIAVNNSGKSEDGISSKF